MSGPCTCGHDGTAHEHYRRGRECAVCPCPSFRTVSTPGRLGLAALAQRRARRLSTGVLRSLLHHLK